MEKKYQLPGSEIKPGHCVIMNEVDCPHSRLVAIIRKVSEEFVWGTYLQEKSVSPVSYKKDVTPVERFGVEVWSDGKNYLCEKEEDSIAAYQDGLKRGWQDPHTPILPLGKQSRILLRGIFSGRASLQDIEKNEAYQEQIANGAFEVKLGIVAPKEFWIFYHPRVEAYYWVFIDGTEGLPFCDKWRCYRDAKKRIAALLIK